MYPDLYHKYVGHDDNRDWFMFTQKETRLSIELVQNKYKPIISHDIHQQGPQGSRIFVPPFTDPFDVNRLLWMLEQYGITHGPNRGRPSGSDFSIAAFRHFEGP